MSWLLPLSFTPPPVKFVIKYSRKGKPTRAISKELHARIVELRKQGLKHWQIGRELGVSRQTVSKHLQGKVKL